MLKTLKQATLGTLKNSGVFTLVNTSGWRQRRLLILAYHGISLADEHLWNGAQFMSAEVFRSRLELLRKNHCAVLPLAEALQLLYAGGLPERSVAITFDDGTYDFYKSAYPLLQQFDYPATLYLTTFYTQFNRPVFDLMIAYLMWKGRHQTLELKPLINRDIKLPLQSDEAQDTARVAILEFAQSQQLSAREKDQLLIKLAEALRVDYATLLEKRIIHNVKPTEVTEMATNGIDIQLHTHRHRTPKDRELFLREIEDNRKSIEAMTGKVATHFCYPSGAWDRVFLPWLREAGIESATTCDLGLASRQSNPLLLPRLIDVSALSPIEFESWLTGISVALPRRRPQRNQAA